MADDTLRYDKMVENALKGVVRDALRQTAERGLPGDHHFYITFRTRHPGARLSKQILARHPEEMTIVLQHQFWDLELDDEAFAVTLSFSGKSERLRVPFAAISGFADPSVKFMLQFQAGEEDAAEAAEAPGPAPRPEPAPPVAEPEAGGGAGGGKVVTLDAFRKK